MSISAYLIGKKVYLISTERVAEPLPPRTLPIGSPSLTQDEARMLGQQLLVQADLPLPKGTPKVVGS